METASKQPETLQAQTKSDAPPSEPPEASENPTEQVKGGDETRSPEDVKPLMVASPLLRDNGAVADEVVYDVKMGWQGKMYEMRVPGNDM